LKQVALIAVEHARRQAADVQDADDAALDDQRDAEQGLDALLAQDRVEDVGVVDVVDRDRALLGGDAAGEAAAERDLHALFDLLLDPLGRARVQPVALEQEDRDGVDLEDLRDPLEQLVEELLLREVGERRVGDLLDRSQLAGDELRCLARVALVRVELRLRDRERGAVGGELQEVAVVVGELARGEAADVQDADHPALGEQWDAE
jgi:hypothetical protein